MPRHVAFLRGINVTGRRVSNSELRACFDELGFGEVATFRASGNVVFEADRGRAQELAARIEAGLAASLTYEVRTFLRTAAQVRAIAAHEPFPAPFVEGSRGRLQVAFLGGRPSAAAEREILALSSDRDRLAFRGSELYWLPSGGTMESPLDLDAIAVTLGGWTMRTKGTVDQIAARLLAP